MRFGLHVSIAGKIWQSVERAHDMGCDAMQIFVGNPRAWREPSYEPEDIELFHQKRKELDVNPAVIHAMYLINMASPNPDLWRKSTDMLIQTIETGKTLGVMTVVVHIGSHGKTSHEEGTKRVVKSVSEAIKHCDDITVSLEPSAGSGDHIGSRFEDLRKIFEQLDWDKRVKVCLDTAHLWAAGYDIVNPAHFDEMVDQFDKLIGLDRLTCLHLNDSKATLDSHLDRHDNIGDGNLGLPTFKHIIHHPKLKDLTAIMETPGYKEPGSNGKNIETIKSL